MQSTFKKVLKNEVFKELTNKDGIIKAPKILSGNTKLEKGKDMVLGLAMLPEKALDKYLNSDYIGKINACPTAKNHGCQKICIGLYSGHYSMLKGSAHKAQIKRSILFHFEPSIFESLLIEEVQKANKKATKAGKKLYIRLDVFSDNKKKNTYLINDILHDNVDNFENIVFYDYTKIHKLKVDENYKENIALSLSKKSTQGKLYTEYLKALPQFNYSALVVPESEVTATIEHINKNYSDVLAVNGDLFDNFTEHKIDHRHVALVLKSKASKNTTKALANDLFCLDLESIDKIYSGCFSKVVNL